MNFVAPLTAVDGWETLARETRYEDAHLLVTTEEVRTPAITNPRRWTVVHRKPAVVIAALTADGKLVLIRQERIPIRDTIWEVPAGQIDEPAEMEPEAMQAVVLRELQEETGYVLPPDSELQPLGSYFSSPGFTDERGHFFLARGVGPGAEGHAHQESESILDCRAFGGSEIRVMIASNEIRDANTLSICAQLIARGFLGLDS